MNVWERDRPRKSINLCSFSIFSIIAVPISGIRPSILGQGRNKKIMIMEGSTETVDVGKSSTNMEEKKRILDVLDRLQQRLGDQGMMRR